MTEPYLKLFGPSPDAVPSVDLGLGCEPAEVLVIVTDQALYEGRLHAIDPLADIVTGMLGCYLLHVSDAINPIFGVPDYSVNYLPVHPEVAVEEFIGAVERAMERLTHVEQIIWLTSMHEQVRYGDWLLQEVPARCGIPLTVAMSEECQLGMYRNPVQHLLIYTNDDRQLRLTTDHSVLLSKYRLGNAARLVLVTPQTSAEIVPKLWRISAIH